MMRTPRRDSRDSSGLKKGTWTPEEDRKLIAYVTRYGCWNWRQIPRFAGLARCGKSCRLRWLNYLRPDVKRGNYSQEEEETIIRLHEKMGNRWSAIAAYLPGRTDNEIKNHWHTTLKKRFEHKSPDTTTSTSRGTGKAEVTKSKNHSPGEEEKQLESENSGGTPHTCPLSPQPSSSGNSSITTDTAATAANHENWVLEDDDLAFLDADIELVSSDFWTEPYLTYEVSYVPPSEATMQLLCEHEYFIPLNDVELWSHYNLDQELNGGLFY